MEEWQVKIGQAVKVLGWRVGVLTTDPSLAGCLVHVPLMTPSGLHVLGPLEVNVCIP